MNQSASSSSAQQASSTSDLYPGAQTSLYPAASVAQTVRFANVDQIMVSARSTGQTPAAVNEVTDLLRQRHRIREDQAEDFSVRDMTEMTKVLTSTTTLMTNLLLCVALVSLIVGGVGIMNIMLVSVTERTREIGLRMAVGARPRDILQQFIVEAVVLCVAGGALGILLGRGSSYLVKILLHWPIEASLATMLAAVAVSVTVGLVFGYYPAWKASRLDPIEALRYE
jgi:ABC-type antimicrobial peptide transport system permease subunit